MLYSNRLNYSEAVIGSILSLESYDRLIYNYMGKTFDEAKDVLGAGYQVEYEEENQLHMKKQSESVYFKFYSDDTGKIIKTEYNNPYVLNSLDNKIGIIQRLEAGEYNGKTEAEVIEYLYSQALYPCDMVHTSNYASECMQIQPGKYYSENIQIEKTSQFDCGYVGTLFFQFDGKGVLINSGVEALGSAN